jgi:hypothetical protein
MSAANLIGMGKGILKSGGMNIIGSMIGSRARKKELREAELGYDKQMAALESQDISNPYMNQENVYEDLTVNTQEADMLAAQQQQSLANTMGNLQGAAGGSGIAALAQSMANQQSTNLQSAVSSIGQQESMNQLKAAGQEDVLNQRFIQGEMYNRKAQASRNAGMLGRAEQRFTDAIDAKTAATQQLMGGIGQVTGFGSETLPGGDLHRVGRSGPGGVNYGQ